MKKIVLIAFASVLFSGCSGMIQTGAVSRAYEAYEAQDYKRTLELISFAQKVEGITPSLEAELTYLKAQTYSKQGKEEKAQRLFRFLAKELKNTEYGYLAYEKMKNSKSPI